MRGAKPALLAGLLMPMAAARKAQEIHRMEPPFRWTGFEHRELLPTLQLAVLLELET